MQPDDARAGSGPLESTEFPEQLSARVVTAGDAPLVHGYEVESDLACHYGYAEYLLLCLTGELPTPPSARAFEVAALFLGPVSVAHASTHAALLSRLCGASTSGSIGVSAIGLAEQARHLVAAHVSLLRWLARPDAELPREHRAPEPDASVQRLASALGGIPFSVPALALRPTREAALLATLWAVGLERPTSIEAAIVLSRLPATLAEAFAERPTNFAHYPINLPRFEYRDAEPAHPSGSDGAIEGAT